MTTIDEPENGSYVAVRLPHTVWMFRRDDQYAIAEEVPDRRWIMVTLVRSDFEDGSDRTWRELTEMGAIAYVGRFVDRSLAPQPKGEPWASL